MVREVRSLGPPSNTADHEGGETTGAELAKGSDSAGLSDSVRTGRDSAADFDELLRARPKRAPVAVPVEDGSPGTARDPAAHIETSQHERFDGIGGLGIGIAMGGPGWGVAGEDDFDFDD